LTLGYPLLLIIIIQFKNNTWKLLKNYHPFITVIIPAYGNISIYDKILNTIEQYPSNKIELIVVYSDPSPEILKELDYILQNDAIKIITEPNRTGKANAINIALKDAKGEICIITDSDSVLEKRAIKYLVEGFADDNVGLISGNLVYSGTLITDKVHKLIFNKYKGKLKIYESYLDSCSYAPGELLAFRRDLIRNVPNVTLCDDYYILLKIRSQNYRCVHEPRAIVYEKPPQTLSGKFKRTRRVTAGTMQEMKRFQYMFLNPKFGFFGLLIFPIYILRILLIPFIMLYLIINLSLFFRNFLLQYIISFGILLVILAFKHIRKKLALFLYGPILIVGILMGIIDWIKGDLTPIWEECKTNDDS